MFSLTLQNTSGRKFTISAKSLAAAKKLASGILHSRAYQYTSAIVSSDDGKEMYFGRVSVGGHRVLWAHFRTGGGTELATGARPNVRAADVTDRRGGHSQEA